MVDQDVSWKKTMTKKVGPSTVEIRGLDASTEGDFARPEQYFPRE